MADEAQAPAEQVAETPTPEVKDPVAVLKQNEELLKELKRFKDLAKQADGFDFEKAKAAIAAQEQAEQDRLTKKGEWDKLKEQLDQRHATELQKAKDAHDALLNNLKREKLTNLLTEKGVLPDRVKYLVHELDPNVELASTDNGFSLSKKGGIGDATEFDLMLDGIKTASPFFFASQTQTGGGASGSGNNTGGGKTITRAQYDANPHAYAEALGKRELAITD